MPQLPSQIRNSARVNQANVTTSSASWDTYWQGAWSGLAYGCGGVNHPFIKAFWDDLLSTQIETEHDPKILDVATGNGAIVEAIFRIFGDSRPSVTCVDVSPAAIANVTSRFPDVRGVVADAGDLPFSDHGFDLVTSQFGVEYAGVEAIFDLPRQVAPGGRIVMLLHCSDGLINEESAMNLQAVQRLQDSGFLPLAVDLFTKGFAAVRGADRAPYDAAGKAFAPAVRKVENILLEMGEHVAADTVYRLYNDVARIHQKMPSYDPQEVLAWLRSMESELVAYVGRMQSMLDAAIDKESFMKLRDDLENRKFSLLRAEPLIPAEGTRPLAWTLVAEKSG